MDYDITEYCGYLICRNGDLYEIFKKGDLITCGWDIYECCAIIDKILRDAYNKQHPDDPLS